MANLITETAVWDQVINDVSGRHDKIVGLNFYEWTFVRSVAVAWGVSSGYRLNITRDELLNIGTKVLVHFTAYEG